MTRSRYKKGEKISSMTEFVGYVESPYNTGLYFREKYEDFGFILNWQYIRLRMAVDGGRISRAEEI